MRTDWAPTAEEYHAFPAISSTALKTFAESPRMYYLRYVARTLEQPEQDYLRKGHMLHTALLEPHRWPFEYVAYEGVRNGKKWEEFKAANKGREIVSPAEVEAALTMARAVVIPASPMAEAARDILTLDGEAEVSHSWIHKRSGLRCKVRWDWIASAEGLRYSVDLKAWKRSDPDGFERDATCRRLGIQRGLYQMGHLDRFGVPSLDFVVAIQNAPPCDVGCYQTSEEELAEGMEESDELLCRLAETIESKEWFSPWQKDVQQWRRKPWARRRQLQEHVHEWY